MNKRSTFFLTLIAVLLAAPFTVFAQAANQAPEMADLMHRNGKIYGVVAVLVVIFLGILLFLIAMDRRISRLERQQGNAQQ